MILLRICVSLAKREDVLILGKTLTFCYLLTFFKSEISC